MRDIRGIIFDCDGVLFDSRQANLAYYNAVLEQLGETPVAADDEEKACLCHTASSPQVLAFLVGEERLEQALALADSLDYRRFVPFMKPEPGLRQALEILSESFPLALATNRSRGVVGLLEHFGLAPYFRTVVTSSDVARPKPHPDMLEAAAALLGLRPEELLFVGDSVVDREAAQKAGISFVAFKEAIRGEYRVAGFDQLVALVGKG